MRSRRPTLLSLLFLLAALAFVFAYAVQAQGQEVTPTREATGDTSPARPTGLQASAEHDSVSLTWTASTDDTVTHYAVLRRDRDTDASGIFQVIDSNAGPGHSYTDRSVSAEGSYVYRVKAVSPTGVSQWSSYATADTPAAPTPTPEPTPEPTPKSTPDPDPEALAPANLSAAPADGGGVALSWSAPLEDAASVTGYEVLRAQGDEELATLVADTESTATNYTDATAAEAGQTYNYVVIALRGGEKSRQSSQAQVQVPHDPADLAPSGLSAKAVSGDDGVIEGVALAWDAPAEDAASVTGYEILRAVGDADLATLEADTGSADTSYTDDTATAAGETYAYRVKALRGEEASQPSDRAVAIIPSVTVVPGNPPTPLQQNVVDICNRTAEVQAAIINKIGGTCSTITDTQLAMIEYLYIDGYSSANIVATDFAGLTGIIEVGINNSRQLTTLQANAFSGLTSFSSLELVSVRGNAIETIDPNAFVGLSAITTLDLSYNAIEHLHPDTFDGLSTLNILDLSFNHIKVLEEGVFEDLSTLTKLHLGNNRIAVIDRSTFAGPSALTLLSLSDNAISTLPEDAFSDLSTLEQLWLRDNELSSLDEGIFDGLTSLYDLDISGNGISTLDEDIFDGLTDLSSLLIRHNSLETIGGDVFDGLTSLEVLDLWGNSLDTLHEDIFDGLTSLQSLGLRGNSLDTLDADIFDGLTSLERLGLRGNSLNALDADIFDGLTSLERLDLRGNSLNALDENIFDGLDNLRFLLLNNNSLNALDENIFDGLTSLQYLLLNNNSLNALDAEIFDGLTDLRFLYLGNNSLDALDADIFDGLAALQRLYINNNSISSLPTELFDPLDDSLQRLYLTKNSIASLPADVFDGLTGLLHLDLSCNSLTALELTRFDPFASSLTYLDITGNSFTTAPTDAAVGAKLTAIENLYISGTNTECLLPNDTALSAFSASTGVHHSFEPTRTLYYVRVARDVSSLTVTFATRDSNATVELRSRDPNDPDDVYDNDPDTDGIQVDLSQVRNSIKWDVRARDGVTTTRYLVQIFRAHPPATNARLRDLTLSGVTMEEFDSRTYSYTATAPPTTAETMVTAFPLDPDATTVTTLNGVEDDDGMVDLRVGSNTITVEVTAEDGTTMQTYTVTITISESGLRISGTALVGEPLTVEGIDKIVDKHGLAGTGGFTFHWLRHEAEGGLALLGHARGSTYEPTAWDAGSQLEVEVRFTDTEGERQVETTGLTRTVRHRTISDDLSASASRARGIWGNEETVWVVDRAGTGNPILAFSRATQRRDAARDFSAGDLDAENTSIYGIWSDGATMYAVDTEDLKIYAYTLAGRSRDADQDITLASGNTSPRGMWGNGSTVWVADGEEDRLFAYSLSTRSHDSGKDFDDLALGTAAGIWSNGTTMWVVDDSDQNIYAYAMSDRSRQRALDIDLDEENESPAGTWGDVDESMIWVVDQDDNILYPYYIPVPEDCTAQSKPTISGDPRVGEVLTADASCVKAFFKVAEEDLRYSWYQIECRTDVVIDCNDTSDEGDYEVTYRLREYGSTYRLREKDEGKQILARVWAVVLKHNAGLIEELSGHERLSKPTDRILPRAASEEQNASPLTGFTVVDTSSDPDTVLGTLEDGGALTLADPANETHGIRVDTSSNDGIHRVVLDLSGAKDVGKTEWGAPYSLYGDHGPDNLDGGNLPVGSYILTATAYRENDDLLGRLTVSFTVAEEGANTAPLTAQFLNEGPLAYHSGAGTTLTVRLSFSEAVSITPEALGQALEVTDATVEAVSRVDDRSDLWDIRLTPYSDGMVTVLLLLSTDCDAPGAVCTADGRVLSIGAGTAIPGPAPDSPATGAPTIGGAAEVGQVLSADVSSIDDDNGLDNAVFSYQWLRSDGDGDTNIQDANGSSYTLVSEDEGQTIRVKVSFTDDQGNAESLTSDPTGEVEAAETVPGRPQDLDGEASAQGIKLTWKAPSGSAVTQYAVYRGILQNGSMNGQPMTKYATIDATGVDMAYTDASVESGVEYRYRVAAVNSSGEGRKSGWVNIRAKS